MALARIASAAAVTVAVALVPACFAADDASDPELGSTEQGIVCNPMYCGGNSPEVARYPIHELNLDHKASPEEKWTYLGMSQDGVVYDLQVIDSRLHASRGKTVLSGTDLLGARLYIKRGSLQYAIVIDQIGATNEVVPPYADLEVYGLDWSRVAAYPLPGPIASGYEGALPELEGLTAVCPEPPTSGHEAWEESSWMPPWGALIFEGDRIRGSSLTVSPTADDRWFDIGCAAHTLNKMRITRSTIHFAKDWYQEQATLKMLSADYCGDGRAFTVAGEPLLWRNAQGFDYWNYNTPTSLEARWSPYGALCIGEPRLAYTTNPDAQDQFPDIWTSIYSDPNCAYLPPCWDWDPYDWEYSDELITSGNWDY